MLENRYDRHRRHVEENQISQIKYQRAQLDAQNEGLQLTREQLELANRQHEELMAAQREQADQARRAQWATWIQTDDGKRYLAWADDAGSWLRAVDAYFEIWKEEWEDAFDAAQGPAAVQARATNTWAGSPTYRTTAIVLGVLAVLTLLKGLIFGFGVLSVLVLVGSIGVAAFCAWKHVTDWVPRNDAARKRITDELNRAMGVDILASYPEWPPIFVDQNAIEEAAGTIRDFIDKADSTYPTSYPAIPALSTVKVNSRWPEPVRKTHAELQVPGA